jgi:Rap1a immunity proteins
MGLIGGVATPKNVPCMPDNVSREQLVRVVIRFMETQPKYLNEDFRVVAIAALNVAWPCKREIGPKVGPRIPLRL